MYNNQSHVATSPIYFDYNATTPVAPTVLESMLPYFREDFGNPSCTHRLGGRAADAIEKGRSQVAKLVGSETSEIYFTSGATEANNLGLFGYLSAVGFGRILVSPFEHPSITSICDHIVNSVSNASVNHLKVDTYGTLDMDDLMAQLETRSKIVSVMAVNNIIGTLQDVERIGEIVKDRGAIFHTDATQMAGKANIDVKKANIDLLSLSSHKIYGPKGCGALYVKEGLPLRPRLLGGGQEQNLRSGTQNVPAIVGFGKACELALQNIEIHKLHFAKLRELFWKQLSENVRGAVCLSDPSVTIPSTVNVAFGDLRGEALVEMLNILGIATTACSACSSNDEDTQSTLCAPLLALELSHDLIRGSVRFSFGTNTTIEEIIEAVRRIGMAVTKLRKFGGGIHHT